MDPGSGGGRRGRRFQEVVEQTVAAAAGDRCGRLLLADPDGRPLAEQPFFVRDLDLFDGLGCGDAGALRALRRLAPRLGRVRTLMVGCVVGEGALAGAGDEAVAERLHDVLIPRARELGAKLVVLKEFPAEYRDTLSCFSRNGYTRIPSFPMTRLSLRYRDFDDLLARSVGRSTRKGIRKKLREADARAALELEVTSDPSACVDELYRLYLAVYDRSRRRFEKLTPEFLVRLGRELPDSVRYFIWRLDGRIVAFSLCTLDGDTIYDEYLGLDYDVALDLHLYVVTLRGVVDWAIANGFRWYCSNPLSYEPKRRLRSELVPLDFYVAYATPWLNALLRPLWRVVEPTRWDPVLRRFPEYGSLR